MKLIRGKLVNKSSTLGARKTTLVEMTKQAIKKVMRGRKKSGS